MHADQKMIEERGGPSVRAMRRLECLLRWTLCYWPNLRDVSRGRKAGSPGATDPTLWKWAGAFVLLGRMNQDVASAPGRRARRQFAIGSDLRELEAHGSVWLLGGFDEEHRNCDRFDGSFEGRICRLEPDNAFCVGFWRPCAASSRAGYSDTSSGSAGASCSGEASATIGSC